MRLRAEGLLAGRIRRGPYLLAGLVLLALKIALDLLVSWAFSRTYTVLFYFSPMDVPFYRPTGWMGYWLTLWGVALPFVAAGLILTVRRLRDAETSPWLALLFFVPFVNVVFFLFCALVPSSPGPDAPTPPQSHTAPRVPYARASLLAGALGALTGGAAIVLSVHVLRAYGGGLFLGAPVIGGFVAAVAFARLHRPLLLGSIVSGLAAMMLAGVALFAFGFEGLVCLAMAAPLVMAGTVMGAALGCLAQRRAVRLGMGPAAVALLLLPLTLGVESVLPLPRPEARSVESEIVISAAPEQVWEHVIAFPPLPPPAEWIFRAGIAAPLDAEIQGEGVGAVRRCRFTTGTFVEPIQVWDPPRELTFAVVSSPAPMVEWTPWQGASPPHLDGFLESVRGQFLLEPLPGGRTRLIGRTWYRTNMVPEAYWRLWADSIIHTIHMRVLRHVAGLSEG